MELERIFVLWNLQLQKFEVKSQHCYSCYHLSCPLQVRHPEEKDPESFPIQGMTCFLYHQVIQFVAGDDPLILLEVT